MLGLRREIQCSLVLAAIAGWCSAATAGTIPQPSLTIKSDAADYSSTLNPASYDRLGKATLAIGNLDSKSSTIECGVLLFNVGNVPMGQTLTKATLSMQVVTYTSYIPTFNASLTGLGLRTKAQTTDITVMSSDYTAASEMIAPAALTKNTKYNANNEYTLDETTVANFNLTDYINEQLALRTSTDAYIALRFIADATPAKGQYFYIGAGEVSTGITTNLNLYYGAIAVPESAPMAVLGAGAAALLLKRRR